MGKLRVKGLFDWARLCWAGCLWGVGSGVQPWNETAQAQAATKEAKGGRGSLLTDVRCEGQEDQRS